MLVHNRAVMIPSMWAIPMDETETVRAHRLSEYLRTLRTGMDRSEAARLSGVSRQWWLDVENAKRTPSKPKLERAVAALGGDVTLALQLAGYEPGDVTPPAAQPSGAKLEAIAADVRLVLENQHRLAEIVEALLGELAPLARSHRTNP